MRRLLLIALPYVVISLSACGDSQVSTPQSADGRAGEESSANNNSIVNGRSPGAIIDACSQITKEEVEAALGATVMEPTRGDELVFRKEGALTSSCMFGTDEGFVSLDIKQQSPASTVSWNATRSYGEMRDLIAKGGGQLSVRLEEVTGLGARAFAQTREEAGNHETTELRVLSKRTILTIRVSALQSTSTLEVAKTVAEKVISRLERYEGDAIAAIPDTPSESPRREVNSNKNEGSKSSKRSQAERRSEKKVERAAVQKASKVASTKSGKGVTRRAAEQRSKVSQKSAQRTPEKSKRETRKTARPSPKNRRRT